MPLEDLPSVRRPYGSGNTVSGVQGCITTPRGVYAQVVPSRSNCFEEEECTEDGSANEDIKMEVDHKIGGSDVDEAEVVHRVDKKWRQ